MGREPIAADTAIRTVRLVVEYDGTDFAGWQRQRADRSVQAVLESALSGQLEEPIGVVGAGRTDAGVHAAGQVASFRTKSRMPLPGIFHGTNSRLPGDVSILAAEEMGPSFHALRDATGKHYRYRILNRSARSPLRERFAARVSVPLDAARMAAAAERLTGRHDLSSFANAGSFDGCPVRDLRRLSVVRDGDWIVIDTEADGFLYKMVRNLVGTLIDAGRRRLSPEEVEAIRDRCDRRAAGPAAPARGLCLVKVFYGGQGVVKVGTTAG